MFAVLAEPDSDAEQSVPDLASAAVFPPLAPRAPSPRQVAQVDPETASKEFVVVKSTKLVRRNKARSRKTERTISKLGRERGFADGEALATYLGEAWVELDAYMGFDDLLADKIDRLHFESYRAFYALRSKAWDAVRAMQVIVVENDTETFYKNYLASMRAGFCRHPNAIAEYGSYRGALVRLRELVATTILDEGASFDWSVPSKQVDRLLKILE
jgi:hypothetical protein